MKKNLLFLATLWFASLPFQSTFAQSEKSSPANHPNRCGTMEHLAWLKQQDPSLQARMDKIESDMQEWIKNAPPTTNSVITIPVVVHVIYANATQSVAATCVQQQIAVLNKDYHKLNTDWNNTPTVWKPLVADCNIQFCLASKDPNGNPTTGIVYKSTTTASWSQNDAVKHTAQGGDDAWPASNYFNVWVCNLGGGLLGYTQFPGGPAATDGVVILYSSLPGSCGAAPYNLGRTLTHECGHWLALYHTWGDDTQAQGSCPNSGIGTDCSGSDQVADTPNQCDCNYGTPTFPKIDECSTACPSASSCGGGAGDATNGTMFMNYMDYVDDAAMFMFTNGQNTRIQATLNGSRLSILSSATSHCTASGIDNISLAESISIYPNPTNGEVMIQVPYMLSMDLKVYNAIGQIILSRKLDMAATKIDLSNNLNGIYLFEIKTPQGNITKKVILNR